ERGGGRGGSLGRPRRRVGGGARGRPGPPRNPGGGLPRTAPADPYLQDFANAGADHIIVHAEAGPHLHRSLQAVRALGKKPGVSINPGTPESAIAYVLDLVDLILVMSVNPGFGGRKVISRGVDQIRALRQMGA